MGDSDAVGMVDATRVLSVEVTDGGGMTAVRMTVARGGETCVLLPTGAVGEMLFLLAKALDVGADGGPPPFPNVPHG